MEKDEFKNKISLSIDYKATEIIAQKKNERYLTYIDAKSIAVLIGNIFITRLKKVPPQVEAAMLLAEATISPSVAERVKLLKSAAGAAGGAAGIALVVTGVLKAIGAGAGMIATVKTFFLGTSLMGPVGMIVGGATIATIAGVFCLFRQSSRKVRSVSQSIKIRA